MTPGDFPDLPEPAAKPKASRFVIYSKDDDGRWLRWKTPIFREAAGAPKDFATQKAAGAHAEENVAQDWNVRPLGTRYSRTQPQWPKPATKAEVKRQGHRMAAIKNAEGYAADGRLPDGGEFRWTIRFAGPTEAEGFATAVRGGGEARSATVEGSAVHLVSGPNHWPGTLFAGELKRFGGEHDYKKNTTSTQDASRRVHRIGAAMEIARRSAPPEPPRETPTEPSASEEEGGAR